METLWAPWRMEYIADKNKPQECIFCQAAQGKSQGGLVLAVEKFSLVMMNKYPYNNGHLLVAPIRHLADFTRFTPEENQEINTLLKKAVAALQDLMHPHGFNLGLNLGQAAGAGIADHLHWHVTPRWQGDTNFMTALAEVRSIPEHLQTTYNHLLPYFK